VAALVALVALVGACGDGDGATTGPTTVPGVPTTGGAETQACEARGAGYRLRYPVDWHVNDPATVGPCRFFHPEPFELPRDSEATSIAVVLHLENVPLNRIAPEEDTHATELLNRREATVGGNRAVRVETRATGEALLPAGVRGVSWYVDLGPRTLVATTLETAEAGTLESNTRILDQMMATLTPLEATGASCSAAGLSATPPAQPELPAPVAATRQAIVAAAVACDYEALADLALGGDRQFTYSFGERGEPAAFWQQAEDAGEPVLRRLVQLLGTAHASRQVEATTQYLWPSAFRYERWDDVPAADREALRSVYGEEDLRRFAQFGSYAGHRVGIAGSGEWIFFVAGD
jgi:hypothetical protein